MRDEYREELSLFDEPPLWHTRLPPELQYTDPTLIDQLDAIRCDTGLDHDLFSMALMQTKNMTHRSVLLAYRTAKRTMPNLRELDYLALTIADRATKKIMALPFNSSPTDAQQILQAALIRDGFVSSGEEIVPEESLAAEHKTALEQLVEKHAQCLVTRTLLHHLHDAEELFRLEKWDASVGQSRNFVEQLLTDIAHYTANQRHESPDLSRPVRVRDYLRQAGFFDEGERRKLVDGVYGYFSEEGSHPGTGHQSTARVCLSILWTFGFYVLEKLEAWTP